MTLPPVTSQIEPKLADQKMPAMLDFQRHANRWLRRLREFASNAGISPEKCGSAGIDFFDVLRANMNIQNGIVLAKIHADRMSAAGHGGARGLMMNRKSESSSTINQSVSAGYGTDSFAASLRTACKQHAYVWKRNIARRMLGVSGIRLPVDRPSMLSLPRMPAHLYDILPVANALHEQHGFSVPFAAVDRRMAHEIRSKGMPIIGIYSHKKQPTSKTRSQTHKALSNHLRIIDIVSRLFDENIDEEFDEEQVKALAASSKKVLHSQFYDAYLTSHALHGLLESVQPSISIVGNAYTLEGRLLILNSKAFNIPSVVIEHGSIFSNDPIWEDCPAEMIFAWGEPSRRALQSCGISKDRIAVTGGPRYDLVFQGRHVNGAQGDDDRARCILVATSGPGDQVSMSQHREFIRALMHAARKHPDIRWIVKLHKKDSAEYYREREADGCHNVSVVSGTYARDGLEIFDYLRKACAMVTISSSAALDAMAVKVPVISYNVWHDSKAFQSIEYLSRGGTRVCANAEELAIEARNAWNGEPAESSDVAAEKYISEHFANRGHATQAVCDQILALSVR